MFFFEQTHSKFFIPYSLPKKISTKLYKNNFIIFSINILLYV
jgi:hypothetical protein